AAAESDDAAPAEAAPETAPEPAPATVEDAPAATDDATTEATETPRGPDSIAESAGAEEAERVSEDLVETPGAEDDSTDDEDRDAAKSEVESVGAEKVEDEIRPRRAPARHYKIQEVIKVRQIMLVQVVKEERGNKGAALTTYLSLAGRYCVLMPNTARGGGISRKITQASDRQKLKAIASELEVPRGMGLIVRTAGAKRTKTEIKRDYEFLLRQWEQVRDLTLASMAPALIYEEGSLIKRSIRDLYGRDIDTILVEGEEAYREAKDYMKMLMPSHAKNVQAHREPTPLFSKFQVESHLSAMFNPTVQLRSGGYIVIGVTEALVAIDVNSGRSTREHSIEETALKTNLEAAEEVARQLRLRDLAGLIVIDFIDMDENRNNRAVEKRLKDKLKDDRARIQIGRISAFGLMEMSRQRLRPGMIEATTAPCAHCHGTGIVRSADNVALAILREVEEEGVRAKVREIRVTAPVAIANFLMNQKRSHVAQIEQRYAIDLLIEGDPAMISPDYKLEKIKGAKNPQRLAEAPRAITAEDAYDGDEDQVEIEEEEDAQERPQGGADQRAAAADGEGKRRRRGKRGGRKRRRSEESGLNDAPRGEDEAEAASSAAADAALGEVIDLGDPEDASEDNLVETREETAQKPKRKRPASRRKKEAEADATPETVEPEAEAAAAPEVAPEVEATPEAEPEPKKPAPKRKPRARKPKAAPEATEAEAKPADEAAPQSESTPEPAVAAAPEPVAAPARIQEEAPAPAPAPQPEPAAAAAPAPDKPRKRGWWS
ncbi:MAG: ribonuclease E/G, partial [Pikeienuella sp.]